MDIKLNDFIKVTAECVRDNFPDEIKGDEDICKIQVIGRRITSYLCMITLDGIEYGCGYNLVKACRYVDEESKKNIELIFKTVSTRLLWCISPEYIASVIVRKTCESFQAKDEQLRSDIKFFFPDLEKEWEHPGGNGFKYL